MKKRLMGVLLSSVMVFSMMGSMTFATSPEATAAGIYDLKTLQNEVTVKPMTADQAEITSKNVLIDGQEAVEYEGAERLQVTVANTADQKFYLVIAKDEDSPPNEANLKYIDQKTSANGSVVFDVYPSELVSGKTYYISLSNNADSDSGLLNVASFKYYDAFTLGDVNDDGSIDSTDARLALQHYVGLRTLESTQFLAADVNFDNLVDSTDARLILQYYVGLRTSF